MVKSGLNYGFGIGFWGPNGHDGVWHISIARSLAGGTWEMPVFAGVDIKNYHLGFDILLSALHKITFIPISILYFQILPIVFSLAAGLFCYRMVFSWSKSRLQGFWATFFLYFGGGLGWLVTLVREGRIDGESIFWSQQSISTLINPPFALSLIFLFLGILLLKLGIEKDDSSLLMFSTFSFGILSQVKIYACILALVGLFLSGLYLLVVERSAKLLKVFVGSLVISILLLPLDLNERKNFVEFRPFWFLESMLASYDRLNWQRLAQAVANYRLGGFWIKSSLVYFFSFVVFLFGNFGTRAIGILYLREGFVNSSVRYLYILATSVVLAGVIIPLFFVQTGNPWNTIQFFYYSLVFMGIFAGAWIGRTLQRNRSNRLLYYLFVGLIVVFTIPTTVGTLWYHYLPKRPPSAIYNTEIEALNFLESLPEGTVLTKLFDRDASRIAQKAPPLDLYLYESTAYVSAFSGKKVFLEDEVNLEITGYDWKNRREDVKKFFEHPTPEFLSKNNIKYLYLVADSSAKQFGDYLKEIFRNDFVVIYKFDK